MVNGLAGASEGANQITCCKQHTTPVKTVHLVQAEGASGARCRNFGVVKEL